MAAKILLVEDDNNLREIYEARLQAEGYVIVTAKDGEEALVVAKAEQPNLVISDVMMPRISGFEMLDILRNTEDLKDTKVIMLTALGQADDKTRANSLGADRYLVKSQVTLEDIVKAAHELVDTGSSAPTPAASPAAPAPAAPMNQPMSSMPPQPAAPTSTPTFSAPAPEPAMPTPSFSSMMGAQPTATPAAAVPTFGSPMPASTTTPSPMPEPATPAPAASPSAMFAAPAPTPPTPAASMSDVASPTTAEEKATVGVQIDNFVQNVGSSAPAPMAPAASAASQDDAVLATAMNDLAANTEKPEETAPEPAPAPTPEPAPAVPTPPTPPEAESEADTTHGSVPIANKKIIQPLNNEPKQSIHELLAKEEAKDIMGSMPAAPSPVAPTGMPGMQPDALNTPPAPTPQAGNVFGPTGQPPVPPLPSTSPSDPNNIAL